MQTTTSTSTTTTTVNYRGNFSYWRKEAITTWENSLWTTLPPEALGGKRQDNREAATDNLVASAVFLPTSKSESVGSKN